MQIPVVERRVSSLGLVAIAMVGCALGCATRHVESPVEAGWAPGATVEIFRGLGGFMQGCDDLQAQLAERGIASTAWNSSQAEEVGQRIVERRESGDDAPIVLVGYAVGGGGVRRTAEYLATRDLQVDAVVLIDPSFFEPVPANVRRCFVAHKPELLQNWNSIMRGNPVRLASAEDTELVHVNLAEHDDAAELRGTTHLGITDHPRIQQLIVNEVLATVTAEFE